MDRKTDFFNKVWSFSTNSFFIKITKANVHVLWNTIKRFPWALLKLQFSYWMEASLSSCSWGTLTSYALYKQHFLWLSWWRIGWMVCAVAVWVCVWVLSTSLHFSTLWNAFVRISCLFCSGNQKGVLFPLNRCSGWTNTGICVLPFFRHYKKNIYPQSHCMVQKCTNNYDMK